MKRQLEFSVLITVTGNTLDSRYHHETTILDFIRELDPVLGESKPTTPGNSEYHYLATENSPGAFKSAVIEALDGGNRDVAVWAMKRYSGDSDIWWATCSDYQNSGILDARKFFELLDSIDIIFEDCGTMGTLGGPLSLGCVPDVAFTSESRHCIVSMRATPFYRNERGEAQPVTEATWDRLKKYYRDPYTICR
jgi:hypothetical protein